MTSAGIIAEYNPIHKGHIYHISKTKELTSADCIIVIMSGDFVQRGEPAVLDKYTRTECALADGADLIVELPCVYSLSSAEQFAAGAVRILSALGTDFLSFGSECGSLRLLTDIASMLTEEPPEFKQILTDSLSKGLSFPAARMKALIHFFPSFSDIINSPNNILAIEYIREILKHNYRLTPVTIPRKGIGYHDASLQPARFASASALRNALDRDGIASIRDYVSKDTFDILNDSYHRIFPVYTDDFSTLLYYRLLSVLHENTALTDFMDISIPLANKIAKSVEASASFTETAVRLKTKDLTYSRIMRSLMHILLNHKKDDVPKDYVRILGFNEKGRTFLSHAKKKCPIPIITKPADYKDCLTGDIFAASVYNRIVFEKYGSVISDDYTHRLII